MSFKLKTIIGIALVEGVLLLVLVLNSLAILRNASNEAINNYAETSARLFATSVENAILSLDLATIESLVQTTLTGKGIVYVRVKAQDTNLAEGGDKRALAMPFRADRSIREVDDGVFDTRASIIKGGVHYGSVEIGISVARMSEFMEQARSETTILALTEMALVAAFSLLFGTYLTRQLLRLENASMAIASGEVGLQVAVTGNDELARTTRAFNLMSSKLKSLYTRIESEHARLHNIIETVHDGIITINDRGVIESANGSACKIFGYKDSDLIGNNINILIPKSYQNDHDGYIRDHVAGHKSHVMNRLRTVDGVRSNGETFPLEIVVSEMLVDNEHKFVGALRDVSDAKEASRKLRKSEALKSTIYNAALDAIITIDANRKIIEFNKIAEEMFGHQREEVIGADLADTILPQHYRKELEKGIREYLETGASKILGQRIEIEAINRGGAPIPIELLITPISLDDQTIYTAFIRDISERKRNEQIIIKAKEQAEAASKAKSEFLAVMSHEIRTPINAVIGSLSILEDEAMNAEQRRHLENAKQGGESMLMVINDILDYSKIEAGKLALESAAFDLLELTESVITMMSVKAVEKNIELSMTLDPRLPRKHLGDPGRLRQILLNLVSNSIKFTSEGGVILSARKADDNAIRFEVEDSGIGISEENQKLLFNKFEQVDSSYSRKYGGTGLGLAISSQLVKIMKGDIGVESKPGYGSLFWFTVTLPAIAGDRHPIDQLPTPGTDIDRVVLCETNIMTRKALQEQLASWGVVVNSSAEAGCRNQLTVIQGSHKRSVDITYAPAASTSRNSVQKPLLYRSLLSILTGTTAQTDSPAPAAAVNTHSGRRILLVEDVIANQLVAKTMLTRAGYEVDIASNGQEAIDATTHNSYDLILMDLSMPQMDGITATQRIFMQLGEERVPPIVAMTANASPQDRERCLSAGMCDFITKPIKRKTLLDCVAKYLSDSAGQSNSHSNHLHESLPLLSGHAPCLNMEALQTLKEDIGEDLFTRAIETYIQEARGRLEHIEQACSAGDIEAIKNEAHALKSSSGTMGVSGLQQLAQELELHCKSGGNEAALSLARKITEYGNACIDELSAHPALAPAERKGLTP